MVRNLSYSPHQNYPYQYYHPSEDSRKERPNLRLPMLSGNGGRARSSRQRRGRSGSWRRRNDGLRRSELIMSNNEWRRNGRRWRRRKGDRRQRRLGKGWRSQRQ